MAKTKRPQGFATSGFAREVDGRKIFDFSVHAYGKDRMQEFQAGREIAICHFDDQERSMKKTKLRRKLKIVPKRPASKSKRK